MRIKYRDMLMFGILFIIGQWIGMKLIAAGLEAITITVARMAKGLGG